MLKLKADKFKIQITATLLIFVIAVVAVCAVFGILGYNTVEKQYKDLYVSNVTSVRDDVLGAMSGSARTPEEFAAAVSAMDRHDFSEITVLNMDGSLVYSTAESSAPDFVNALGKEAVTAFRNKNGATVTVTEGDVATLYVFAPYTEFSSERYAASMPYTEHHKTMTTQLLITIFQCLLVVILTLACGLVLSYVYKHRNDVLPQIRAIKNFILTVSHNGTVIYANKYFTENFDVKNISSGYREDEVSFYVALTEGHPIVCNLTDKDGNEKKLVFTAVTSMLGYKLVGSDMTRLLGEYDTIRVEVKKDADTGLWNEKELQEEWAKLAKANLFTSSAIVQMRVKNLDYFRMLFGDVNVANGTKSFIEKIKELFKNYGELFALDNGDVALLVTEKDKREELIGNLGVISDRISTPIMIDENLIQIDVCMGVLILDKASTDTPLENVLLSSGHALKYAHDNPNTPYYVMRSPVFAQQKHDLTTKEGITDLLASGSVDVYFQPQYNIVENKVVGFESLFRIVGEYSKEINVFDFIAAAERNGLIVDLGKFIYNRAMDFAVTMKEFGVTVSINVSPIQLMQVGFVETFLDTYNSKHLNPGSIDVEIVESSIIYSLNEVVRKLNVLQKNGIGTHIDDFGVAYSSMLYLKRLPVSTLKIDKAFIDGITESKESYAIVKNIVNICSDLSLGCIAEGVETDEQVALLKKMGCSVIQGFWMSSAMPKEKAYEFIKEKNK